MPAAIMLCGIQEFWAKTVWCSACCLTVIAENTYNPVVSQKRTTKKHRGP